jgi:hypothetical protein
MARESKWDMALGLAGVAYLAMVLFMGLEIPVFGAALIVLAAYALIRPHRTNSRKTTWPRMNTDKHG